MSFLIDAGKGRITAAMIASTEIGTPDELRVRNYVDNFTASVFEGVNLGYEINFKYWPPIFSQVLFFLNQTTYFISSFGVYIRIL